MEENRKRGALSVNMTEGSLWKNMLLFSLPLMMTQVLEVLFNLSDVAIAGKFADYRALGAVGSTTLLVSLFTGLLIGCIPVGVDAAYGEGGIRLAVKIWLFRLQLLPQKPKKKKKPAKKAAPKQKKPAPEKPAGEKKPNPLLSGGVDGILELLDLGVQTLGDLRRKLRVEELTLHVCIGGSDDPAAAAMRYGRAWAAIGAITPALDRH